MKRVLFYWYLILIFVASSTSGCHKWMSNNEDIELHIEAIYLRINELQSKTYEMQNNIDNIQQQLDDLEIKFDTLEIFTITNTK